MHNAENISQMCKIIKPESLNSYRAIDWYFNAYFFNNILTRYSFHKTSISVETPELLGRCQLPYYFYEVVSPEAFAHFPCLSIISYMESGMYIG